MKLNDTCELMVSNDYKDRFRAEYYQLDNRIEGLHKMLIKYQDGTLKFSPVCSYDLLNSQLKIMELYRGILEERAVKEEVEL